MGLFSRKTIEAQEAPQVITDRIGLSNTFIQTPYITREEALSVPAIARCHSLISGTIASMDLKLESKATGEYLPKPVWMDQPSLHQPRAVTIALTVSDLFFYGVSYWKITEVYQDDGRPARFEWVSPTRVTQYYNKFNTYVEGYAVDGYRVPMSGLDSLVTFQTLADPGILSRGAKTIKAAIDLETAASVASATPMPSGVLKNTGADLGEAEVQGLLAAWKAARKNRSTAYLTSTLEYQATSFSPSEMAYSDAQQYLATQCARMCNVPAHYISASADKPLLYSNLQDERRQFAALTLMPYIEAVQSRLSMDDLTPRTQYVEFDVDSSFLEVNPMERLNVIEKMLALNLITLDEAKKMEGLTPQGSAEV